MKSLEERVITLETNVNSIVRFIYAMQQTTMGFSIQSPTTNLPFEQEEQAPLLPMRPHHFGLDAAKRAHWVTVYGRLVAEKKLKACEVSGDNFTYLLCGVGTAPQGRIRWYGTTRELAYMVRQHLGAQWDAAAFWFNDKNDKVLPRSFSHSKAPSEKLVQKIDHIFRTRDYRDYARDY